jgi:hypothetical protein
MDLDTVTQFGFQDWMGLFPGFGFSIFFGLDGWFGFSGIGFKTDGFQRPKKKKLTDIGLLWLFMDLVCDLLQGLDGFGSYSWILDLENRLIVSINF